MNQELNNTKRWPFPFKDYIYRLIWGVVKNTIWKLCWHRFWFLRMLILRAFGSDVSLTSMAFGSTNITRAWDIVIGRYVALGPRVHIYNLNKVIIGDNTVISQDAYICGGTHDYTDKTLPLLREDVVIGNNVWICAGAFIAPGVTIGEGAVIAARSVVVKDVEPWTIVGGNPASFIKKRTIKETEK